MAAAHGGNSIITRHGKALRWYQQQKSDKNNTVIIIITGLPPHSVIRGVEPTD